MGLTGIILRAAIRLKPIVSSYIEQNTIKTNSLEHTLDLFEQTASAEYSVAWIDCLARGKNQGRCILTTGKHSDIGGLEVHAPGKLAIPCNFPSMTLNSLSIKAFNTLYYHKVRESYSSQFVHYDPYFYPLDKIHNWNRMYGKNGFIQYQFVVPYETGLIALKASLEAMAASGRASFLAVLKHLGPENNNYLSFPMEGYTLAVDFKWHPSLPRLIAALNKIVMTYGGRIYLAKDSVMEPEMLRKTYPQIDQFITMREKLNAKPLFNSLQSTRLKI
jgi:FAD/FMN-containing dehydrogenase